MLWACTRFSFLLLLATSCNRHPSTNTPILLASSLITLEPLIKSQTGENLSLGYGSSSFIAKQILKSHPCKAAIIADNIWAQEIDEKPTLILKNTLVIASSKEIIDGTLEDLLTRGPLIVADKDTVPLGRFSQQVIHNLGLKNRISSKKAATARQTLFMIEASDYLGIIYLTDARSSSRIRFIKPIPKNLHDDIGYYLVNCQRKDGNAHTLLMSIVHQEAFLQEAERIGFTRPQPNA